MQIPSATYRVQACPSFALKDVCALVPYLKRLGVSHLYLSPIFKARQGSTHGYDIVDPRSINDELGGMEQFEIMVAELRKHDIRLLQDIVPNHMAFDSGNEMLMDVFENGEFSPYYHFFDIDWNHPYESMKGRVLVPMLGKFYAECLENGEITLTYDENGFGLRYYELSLPLRIETYLPVLEYNSIRLEERLGKDHPGFINYIGIVHFLKAMGTGKAAEKRYEQIHHVKVMLWDMYKSEPVIKDFMDETIRVFNGVKGEHNSFDLLDAVISDQFYRLSFWKVATEEINYRRFFTVNDLISVRVEDEAVFEETHRLIRALCRDGLIDGVRIDHIDGLYDPTMYLERLRAAIGETYVIVEKILEAEEHLPAVWPIAGTTGYDFMNYLNGLFCDKDNDGAFSKIYYRYTGLYWSYDELVYEKKRLIIGKHMAGNIDNLAQFIKKISDKDRFGRDITLYALRRALVEVMALFPVYRTYINGEVFSEADEAYIRETIMRAKEKRPELWYEFNFLEKFLLLRYDDVLSDENKREWLHFVMAFQQQTGPLMAKGFEDTILYIFNRLISLNEVGGNPIRFGYSREEFHACNTARRRKIPYTMNATATHDTKRGEDVRARINVLTELPDEWGFYLKQWARLNRAKRKKINSIYIPDANDEYFLYQTLLGTYPFADEADYIERIKEYSIKAVREAKVHTAWIKPDEVYEAAFVSFVEKILQPAENNRFLQSFLPFQKKIAWYGMFNSLSQVLLKMTSPGVPDFYQGTELWDFSLVDPDSRRAVDFEKRKAYLDYITHKIPENIFQLIDELRATKEDGRIKLFLTHRVLHVIKANPHLFHEGAYVPLSVEGSAKECVVAFARVYQNQWAVTVAPRFISKVAKENEDPVGAAVWHDTHIVVPDTMPHIMQNMITSQHGDYDKRLYIKDVLAYFPVALLSNI